MSLSRPSEAQLAAAIDALKARPGAFQRLAELFARLRSPDRYRDLISIGRNPDDGTVRGWPDAEVRRPDGRIDAMEATHSPRWERHLESDLEKIAKAPLASFLFVAWAQVPSRDKESDWLDRIAAEGVPRSEIRLVFRQQLLAELSQPRYARLWLEPLGLSVSAYPFRLIEDVHELFGAEERLGAFLPSRSEYRDGRVHSPALTSEIEACLNQRGWALVRGHGASGKTVLATSLGLDRGRAGPAYYVDLSDWEPGNEPLAEEAQLTSADSQVLFIVDNVHLEPSAARRLFDFWLQNARGSHLLLLGRLTTRSYPAGRLSPLSELTRRQLELTVQAQDLLGVYRRLLLRLSPNEPPAPPAEVLDAWLERFGGELVAFSAAVARRAPNLRLGEWGLRPEHARDYISDHYLAEVDREELDALRGLVALSEFELSATATALGSTPKRSLESGLVLRSEHGKAHHLRYRFSHPGIADLLSAAMVEPDKGMVLRELASRDSFLGVSLAARLRSAERNSEAREVLRSVASSSTWFSGAFSPRYLGITSRHFLELGVLTSAELEQRLLDRPEFLDSAFDSPLDSLKMFLTQEQLNDFTALRQKMLAFLNTPGNGRKLATRALESPPNLLVSFLAYAQRDEMGQVRREMLAFLNAPENAHSLAVRALESPLNILVSFLAYTEREELAQVRGELLALLNTPENARSLAMQALESPLNSLTSLLAYAKRGEMTRVREELLVLLGTPEKAQSLAVRALESSLNILASFLAYAKRKEMTRVREELLALLDTPESARSLAERSLQSPLDHLASFLASLEGREMVRTRQEMLAFLNTSENARSLASCALRTPLESIASFLAYAERAEMARIRQEVLAFLNTPDNARSLAERALETPLDHLASFLAYAESHGMAQVRQEIHAFLDAPENARDLAARALDTPLDHLASFLGLVGGDVRDGLVERLKDRDALAALGERALTEPLDKLRALLKVGDLATHVAEAIDAQAWVRRRLDLADTTMLSLLLSTVALIKCGRKDLAAHIGKEIVRETRSADIPTLRLWALSWISASLEDSDQEQLTAFLGRLWADGWLPTQLRRSSASDLAQTLFLLWSTLPPPTLRDFRRPVQQEFLAPWRHLRYVDPRAMAAALRFVGTASLFGAVLPKSLADLHGRQDFASMIRATRPPEPPEDITTRESQLWLGLRAVANGHSSPLHVPSHLGEDALARWRATRSERDKYQRLNRILISWLEACSGADWELVQDDAELPT